jgi:hypothetical protein
MGNEISLLEQYLVYKMMRAAIQLGWSQVIGRLIY